MRWQGERSGRAQGAGRVDVPVPSAQEAAETRLQAALQAEAEERWAVEERLQSEAAAASRDPHCTRTRGGAEGGWGISFFQ